MGSSLIAYQDFSWGGGHIPPLLPSLESGSFPFSSPNPFVGWGGPMGNEFQSIGMPSTSILFTFYGGFESNPFTSFVVLARGNPFQGQWNPKQESFSSQGMSSGVL